MNFDMRTPCKDCPFRTDHPIQLREGRMAGILNDVLHRDKTFACHKTTHGAKREVSHCAGALIAHEKAGKPNWIIRLAHQLGFCDPKKLNMKAPVGTEQEILDAHKLVDC